METTYIKTDIQAIRNILKSRYEKFHTAMPFTQAMRLAIMEETRKEEDYVCKEYAVFLSYEEFWDYVGRCTIPRRSNSQVSTGDERKEIPTGFGNFYLREKSFFTEGMDINIYTHLPFVDDGFHTHDHFELNYIYRGNGHFWFEEEQFTLTEGALLVIAPDSPHNVRALDDDFIISIMIRKSTFNKIFWSLLNKDTLISSFFKNALSQNSERNYVLFQTDNNPILQSLIQQLMAENGKVDAFVNDNMICMMQLFFSSVLRDCSDTAQLYNVEKISSGRFDVQMLSQYIRQHYATVTLKDLAEKFHYSEAFLSRLIKKNFGKSFSELIRAVRLSYAQELLQHSSYTLKEICEIVGYNSVSAFSRSYKEQYGVTPRSHYVK